MEYTQEEWNWLEAEWAFHCHGRTAFISPEDFRQAKAWAEEGIPAEAVVSAMESFFERRAKRPRPRAFVTLAHLKKDVEKAMSLRRAISRAGDAIVTRFPEWGSVKAPLNSDPRAKAAFEAWMRLKHSAPTPESSGYLEHLDSERAAHNIFVYIAADALGPKLGAIKTNLAEKLKAVDIQEDSSVWNRAWNRHFSKDVCAAWGLDGI
ncbi:MAG: hypothetical protein LBQ86_03175 [Holophagales bacterium]|jgi:hypothetical protein|nr:hypothetical protein [Holophagales bacterium]